MRNNVVIYDDLPTYSYIIHADCVIQTKYHTVKQSNSQIVIKELVDYFTQATKNLRQKRRELFQE